MHLKKLFALFLSLFLLLSLWGCKSNSKESVLPENDDLVVMQDTVAELFNAAVDKLLETNNYRMSGNVTSLAELFRDESTMGSSDVDLEPPTVILTNLDCAYDQGKMYIECPDGSFPHTTYFDGEIYYHDTVISGNPVKYFTSDPSFEDHDAAKYLKKVNAEMIFSPAIIDTEDGGKQISFTIPFAFYRSEALVDWLGILVDETHDSQYVSLKITLDKDGYIIAAHMSFSTVTNFGDENIQQEVIASLRFSDYGSTQVVPPVDLAEYEDWSEEDIPESTAPMVELTPEDLE